MFARETFAQIITLSLFCVFPYKHFSAITSPEQRGKHILPFLLIQEDSEEFLPLIQDCVLMP